MISAMAAARRRRPEELPPHALQEPERRGDPSERTRALGECATTAPRCRRRRCGTDAYAVGCPPTPQCGRAVVRTTGGQARRGSAPSIVTVAVGGSPAHDASAPARDAPAGRPTTGLARGRRASSGLRVPRRVPQREPDRRSTDQQIVTATAKTMTEPSFGPDRRQPVERPATSPTGLAPWNAYPTPWTVRMNRGSAVLAELAADPGHVGVDDAAARVVAVPPHAVHQLRRGSARRPGSRASVTRISNSSGVRPTSSPSTVTRRRLGSIVEAVRARAARRALASRASGPCAAGSPSPAPPARAG